MYLAMLIQLRYRTQRGLSP
uniref:BLTX828 n=1 Tax=Nephila pilipes TaxID=299642 RepID=A0A076KUT3_NEPPI|nr:BLTX828 [Nephila pilipes]